MATKNVDPRRDIWGALIAESEETKTELGGNDSHFLFIGGPKSGKSSLQNAFFNRTDDPRPTLALSYQSCNIHAQEQEKTLQFWELGSGMKLEQILNSIITPEIQKNFYVFICFNLNSFSSISDAIKWLPVILRRFKSGIGACFLVATHYDEFEEKDPSEKAKIINGCFSLCYQYGSGLITFSPKDDFLISRFKSLVKSFVIPDVKKPERVANHTGPTLIYPGDNTGAGTSGIQSFVSFVTAEMNKETNSDKTGGINAVEVEDKKYADEEIDSVVREQGKILDDKLKALIASI